MNINEVNTDIQKNSATKRLGRGTGSGLGKTSGRGHKGQGARAGFSMPAYFEGGQMPLARRIPKRGFNNKRFAPKVVGVNVEDLEFCFEKGEAVTPQILVEKKIVKAVFDRIKVLGNGDLTKSLSVSAHAFSKSAQSKIEAAGGTVTVLPGPKPVVKNKMGSKKAKAK
ncbi:MAG: 50S ribosomal protein L15 [Planctomycetaceae bacterium]|nr:50S ribosomal protein L15 [Planctomycetaceae bacterium]